MGRSARVQSIDALNQLAAAIRVFAEEASAALADLGMDLHRAIQWVQYDQKEYWSEELRRAEAAVAEAKLHLERRRMFRMPGEQPSCRAEEKALEAARRRLEQARQKLEAVKRWSRLLDHHATEFRSALAPLTQWLQADVPQATALLKQMSLALESYVSLAPQAIGDASSSIDDSVERVAGCGWEGQGVQPARPGPTESPDNSQPHTQPPGHDTQPARPDC